MGKFLSNAEWPSDVYRDMFGRSISTDLHDTASAAHAVCEGLRRDGFGGERKAFPIRTWVQDVSEHFEWFVPPQSRGSRTFSVARHTAYPIDHTKLRYYKSLGANWPRKFKTRASAEQFAFSLNGAEKAKAA